MAYYYVNKNGDHEVHTLSCSWVPDADNRIYLGEFSSCAPAVQAAKKHYPKADGCKHCSEDCHTG